MLLELQQSMASELAEKDVAYQQLLERYNIKLANEYGKKPVKIPHADEVFNEVELVLDEHDKKLLSAPHVDATKKQNQKVWQCPTYSAKSSRVNTSLAYRYTAKKRCLAILALN